MKRFIVPLIACALFAFGRAEAALPQFLQDCAALDQDYIPALMLSNAKSQAKAMAAQEKYQVAWTAFAARNRNAKPGNAAWAAMFATIDKANAQASAALAAGKMSEAHGVQEEVRHALWHERQALGLDYHPDRLTAFHATMERLIDAVAGKSPADISPTLVASMKTLFGTARTQWQAVKASPWVPADYGLDAARLEAYKAAVAAEDKALDELGAALDAGDASRINQAAPAIKGPFSRAYRAFGVFPD